MSSQDKDLHAPDRSVPYIDTVRAIDELYKEGKFEEFGLSNYPAWDVVDIIHLCKENGFVQPTVYQGMYNAISRTIEPELIPAIRKFGLRLITYNPLAGGFFTGKASFDAKGLDPSDPFHPDNGWLGPIMRAKYLKDGQLEALKIVSEIAAPTDSPLREQKKHNLTLPEIGHRWVQHHSRLQPGDGIVFGASSVEHVQQNVANAEKGPLPEEVVAALDMANKVVGLDAPFYAQMLVNTPVLRGRAALKMLGMGSAWDMEGILDKRAECTITLRKDWNATFEEQRWTLVPPKTMLRQIIRKLIECKTTGIYRPWNEFPLDSASSSSTAIPKERPAPKPGRFTAPYEDFPLLTSRVLHPYFVILSAYTAFHANEGRLKYRQLDTYGLLKIITGLWSDRLTQLREERESWEQESWAQEQLQLEEPTAMGDKRSETLVGSPGTLDAVPALDNLKRNAPDEPSQPGDGKKRRRESNGRFIRTE
ncbi:hypothetical protein EVG20_g10409 [Dentipellis fragilis]|uniref:NADP-dependent oxidoreductase domain-containing protein n=1 Tax=Dentipellis fragilis TaxID=205917 RepID=A0A4Y9XRQ8_9AGAM|nr:hypothetical protein EVG20_g10409 [Dentipellis fragilis]